MLWRIAGNKYGMLVLGIVLLGIGIYTMNQTEVMCGSDAMKPGDICETTRRGSTTERNYEEEKANQQLTSKIMTGAGGALTLGGIGWIVVPMVRRKPEEQAAASPVAVA